MKFNRGVYAPMSNIGGLFYDKDAVYLEADEGSDTFTKETNEEQLQLVQKMKEKKLDVDKKLESAELKLFDNSKPITSEDLRKGKENGTDTNDEEGDKDDDDDDDDDDNDDDNMVDSDG